MEGREGRGSVVVPDMVAEGANSVCATVLAIATRGSSGCVYAGGYNGAGFSRALMTAQT